MQQPMSNVRQDEQVLALVEYVKQLISEHDLPPVATRPKIREALGVSRATQNRGEKRGDLRRVAYIAGLPAFGTFDYLLRFLSRGEVTAEKVSQAD